MITGPNDVEYPAFVAFKETTVTIHGREKAEQLRIRWAKDAAGAAFRSGSAGMCLETIDKVEYFSEIAEG